jgi:hypothetical protein
MKYKLDIQSKNPGAACTAHPGTYRQYSLWFINHNVTCGSMARQHNILTNCAAPTPTMSSPFEPCAIHATSQVVQQRLRLQRLPASQQETQQHISGQRPELISLMLFRCRLLLRLQHLTAAAAAAGIQPMQCLSMSSITHSELFRAPV